MRKQLQVLPTNVLITVVSVLVLVALVVSSMAFRLS